MKKCFTLVELLVVIAVIAILIGIALPGLGKVRANARVNQARADVVALTAAMKQIESTYSGFRKIKDAGYVDADTGLVKGGSNGYEKIIAELVKPKDLASCKFNTRRTKLLDSKKHPQYTDDNLGWLDPWEREYVIYLDIANNGYVEIGGKKIYKSVVVYSLGENGEANTGNVTKDDDVMLDQ